MASWRLSASLKRSISVGAASKHLLLAVAGHLEEALIDLDEPQVAEPADDRGRGVCRKGLLEALFRLKPIGRILEDKDETIGLAFVVVDHQAANAVDPLWRVCSSRRDFDDDVVEPLTANDTLDRIFILPRCDGCCGIAAGNCDGIR